MIFVYKNIKATFRYIESVIYSFQMISTARGKKEPSRT